LRKAIETAIGDGDGPQGEVHLNITQYVKAIIMRTNTALRIENTEAASNVIELKIPRMAPI
jgi:hypothetical protein